MYSMTVTNSTGEYALFNTFDDEIKVANPKLELELNKSGTLTFEITSAHPNRDQILPLASEVYVYRNGTVYWVGRPIIIEETLDLVSTVTCEGVLGYLLDTQIPPFNFTGTNSIKGAECVKTFLERLVTRHNTELSASWVDQRKRFYVGNVTIYDSNNNLARSSEGYATTLETINQKLLETHGGYLRVRYSGSTRYIDYIDTFGNATQPISFGDNLLDLSAHVKTEEIATVVIPLGAQNDKCERLTLSGYKPTTAVANRISEMTHGGAIRTTTTGASSFTGFIGIYDKQGEDSHGRVFVTQTWDDVTLKENLALKAAEYIGTISVLGETIDLNAVDLAQIDVDYHSFNLGEMATVVSIPHGINAPYQITQMSIDLYNPANSTLTLGGESRTFTFDNTKKQAEMVAELSTGISDAVQNATALLSGGLGGYLIIRQDESGQPYEILIMNQATEESATNCVRINKNGLGFGKKASGQSAASWVYRNAWTIDGNLIADFITTGTLNANLLKTGTIQDQKGNTTINLSNGTLSMKKGNINLGNGKFVVNDSGALTATSGTIAGYGITSTGFHIDKTSSSGRRQVLHIGSSISSYNESFMYASIYGRYSGGGIVTTSIFDLLMDGSLKVSPRRVSNAGDVYGGASIGADMDQANLGYNSNEFYANRTGLWINGSRLYINPSQVYITNPPSSSAHSGTLFLGSDWRLYQGFEWTSSSQKIKHDIKPVRDKDLAPEKLYDAEIIQFTYNEDLFEKDDPNRGKSFVGFIVENLNEVYPSVVNSVDEDSKDWTWSEARIIPPMLKLIQDQKKKIDDLETRVGKLEQMITKGE